MSLFGDLLDITTTPIKIAVDVAEVITEPLAEIANDVVAEVEDALDD